MRRRWQEPIEPPVHFAEPHRIWQPSCGAPAYYSSTMVRRFGRKRPPRTTLAAEVSCGRCRRTTAYKAADTAQRLGAAASPEVV